MKNKIIDFFKMIRQKIAGYFYANKLFILFVVFALIETILIRNYTVGHPFAIEPLICDLGLIIIVGSFAYLMKPKKQFRYYFIALLINSLVCFINSIYYLFFTSFTSFSLLAELGLVGEVGDSVLEKLRFIDFLYWFLPAIYLLLHYFRKKGSYYQLVGKIQKGKKYFGGTLLAGIIVLIFTVINITGTDASRLVKQWNREYIVTRFGIVLYQGNDLVQSLTPKINSLFGYDEAAKQFKDFYGKNSTREQNYTNKYTGVLNDMNVIFIHMESIQNFLVDMKVNDVEITPTINKLSKEGLYFDNFYPQISVGTSSDTEFTLNTSLMPALSGTVFVSYYNRDYVSIPKLLRDKGYYTFSSHGNNPSMWNRSAMHPNLGYDDMIFKDKFDVTPQNSVGLGISDEEFFKQLQTKLEKIETDHDKYMGTLIQLSNHSPYADTDVNPVLYDSLGKLELTNTYTKYTDVNGIGETVTDKYLSGTKMGSYLISAHYADVSLGTFMDYVNNSEYYNNTIFVLYGDHDARLDKSEYQFYYNYDVNTGKLYTENDPEYTIFDNIDYELNKKTPLIIWTKNEEVKEKIKGVNHNVIGMYDIMPTLGNMMGFYNPYALGHDIFEQGEDNIVIFPSGNFITNKVYYNNTSNSYRTLFVKNKNGNDVKNVDIEDGYIENLKDYTEERLTISNDIIVHDLISKEGKNLIYEDEKGEVSG